MIIIMGRAGTGKTSLVNELVNRGYEKIKTCTTRPIRPGEEDGVDYFFMSDEQFRKYMNNGVFAEIKRYETTDGVWWYGTPKVDLLGSYDKSVIILTPDGVRSVKPLLDSNNVDYKVILLGAKASLIKRRMVQRGDDMDEVIRRLQADETDFEDCSDIADYVISNDSSITELADKVENILEKENHE